MFEITDAEKLRDAYTLLAFIRDDVPTTTAEQKSSLAAFMVSIKKEIRAYNNRPAPDSRIVEERGIDGYIELVQLPNELDKARNAVCFWPIMVTVNGYEKYTTAKLWNKEHAQIEIVEGIDKTHIAEYFRDRAQQCDKWIERYTWDFGADSNSVKEQEQYKAFYESVVARLEV